MGKPTVCRTVPATTGLLKGAWGRLVNGQKKFDLVKKGLKGNPMSGGAWGIIEFLCFI